MLERFHDILRVFSQSAEDLIVSRANAGFQVLLLLTLVFAVSCQQTVARPLPGSAPQGVLDLSTRPINSPEVFQLTQWLWDDRVLWSPAKGRPVLPPAVLLGGPDTGGTLVRHLMQPFRPGEHGGTTTATLQLTVLFPLRQPASLQIGSFPGVQSVWANGVLVFESRSNGTVLQLNPLEGRLELVVQLTTDSPLVLHDEVDRRWLLAVGTSLVTENLQDQLLRLLQVTALALSAAGFFAVAFLWRHSAGLLPLAVFLTLCLLRLIFNVEQPAPLFPGLSWPFLVFLSHGLNLAPFPAFAWFLNRWARPEVPNRTVKIVLLVTAATTFWEFLPLLLLLTGADGAYSELVNNNWRTMINLVVVVGVLYLFERIFAAYRSKRPLGSALFFGGLILAVAVLLSVFLGTLGPVKSTAFLSWGLLGFLLSIANGLLRAEFRRSHQLTDTSQRQTRTIQVLSNLLPPLWFIRLGKTGPETAAPGDKRTTDSLFLELTTTADSSQWLAACNTLASQQESLLLRCDGSSALWQLRGRAETGLQLALEIRSWFTRPEAPSGDITELVLTRSAVELEVLDAGVHWQFAVRNLPEAQLAKLRERARACHAALVLDAALKDGLVSGRWRRHRLVAEDGTAIELFEGETGPMAELKMYTLATFEEAMTAAGNGNYSSARALMVEVLQRSPLDSAARFFLNRWNDPAAILPPR